MGKWMDGENEDMYLPWLNDMMKFNLEFKNKDSYLMQNVLFPKMLIQNDDIRKLGAQIFKEFAVFEMFMIFLYAYFGCSHYIGGSVDGGNARITARILRGRNPLKRIESERTHELIFIALHGALF